MDRTRKRDSINFDRIIPLYMVKGTRYTHPQPSLDWDTIEKHSLAVS